jgi:hypothetical protein
MSPPVSGGGSCAPRNLHRDPCRRKRRGWRDAAQAGQKVVRIERSRSARRRPEGRHLWQCAALPGLDRIFYSHPGRPPWAQTNAALRAAQGQSLCCLSISMCSPKQKQITGNKLRQTDSAFLCWMFRCNCDIRQRYQASYIKVRSAFIVPHLPDLRESGKRETDNGFGVSSPITRFRSPTDSRKR